MSGEYMACVYKPCTLVELERNTRILNDLLERNRFILPEEPFKRNEFMKTHGVGKYNTEDYEIYLNLGLKYVGTKDVQGYIRKVPENKVINKKLTGVFE